MQGYIRKRGKDSWEVTVGLGRDPSTGRRRRRFLLVRGTKRDAERALAEAVHQRDTGRQNCGSGLVWETGIGTVYHPACAPPPAR